MLEIIFVVLLWNKMGDLMRGKGYEKPFWFQFFVPVFWLGGEVTGGFIYGVVRAIQGEAHPGMGLYGYLSAIVGAGFGAGAIFLVASCFSRRPAVPPPLPAENRA
jgi:hypothetical protein